MGVTHKKSKANKQAKPISAHASSDRLMQGGVFAGVGKTLAVGWLPFTETASRLGVGVPLAGVRQIRRAAVAIGGVSSRLYGD